MATGSLNVTHFGGRSNLVVVFFAGNFVKGFLFAKECNEVWVGKKPLKNLMTPCPMLKRILAKKTCWIPVGFIGWNSMFGGSKGPSDNTPGTRFMMMARGRS